MVFDIESVRLLEEALHEMAQGFSDLPPLGADDDNDRMREVLATLAVRMQDNYPYHHPMYAGQMLKPPHPIARLAYALALWLNPNNHALDGGRATSALEKESVADLGRMFGWQHCLGHLCGGGTMANLEALWVAGLSDAGAAVVASEQAHYTHRRISEVLGLPFETVPCDARARMDVAALETVLQRRKVGTVVVTAGTTATGSVDPLTDILDLRSRYDFRIHVDAAYGGYFSLASNLAPDTTGVMRCIGQADSIVIDPHKHGLQPYGCGCVLFRDASVGRFYDHHSPYTYFTSTELHLGEISLECSRAGAAAAALWATMRMFPLTRGGAFSQRLEQSHQAALDLHARLAGDPTFVVPFEPELDIVVFAVRAESASEASARARAVFELAASRGLHLALATLPRKLFETRWKTAWDRDTVVCLRSVLMKPQHLQWTPRIWTTLTDAAEEALQGCNALSRE